MPGLILEGGTFRPIFSAGVMDALLDNNLLFDYVIGVSAGITNGVSYVSKQTGRNLEVLMKYRHDKRYIGKRNFLKCRSLFGLDFMFKEIPETLAPFDWDTYVSNPCVVRVGVTNARTGKPEYYDGKLMDSENTMLRATCAIPLFFPAIKMNDSEYYDGGLCDPIPIKKAMEDGNEKNLIVLTQPEGYVKQASKQNELCAKILRKKYPALVNPLLNRHVFYNETVKFCEELEKENKAVILRPDHKLDSFEKDLDILKKTYDEGYQMVIEHLDEIKALFE